MSEPIHITSNGDVVSRVDDTIKVEFGGRRRTITTSWVNGGVHEGLTSFYNHRMDPHCDDRPEMEGGSVPEFVRIVAGRNGLDPALTSGLLTAADMGNASMVTERFRGLEVTAIVTAGIGTNGGRAGDPAYFYQEDSDYHMVGGTIITIVLINGDVPDYTLVRAVMTATEAKAAALQELVAPSRYSEGVATGSGTDMIAIAADMDSDQTLTESGKHSKLGELIGTAVIRATKGALSMQEGLDVHGQSDVMRRLERFRIDECDVVARAGLEDEGAFHEALACLSKDQGVLSTVVACLHLHDEASWGMVDPDVAKSLSARMLSITLRDLGAEPLERTDLDIPSSCAETMARLCIERLS